MTNSDTTKTDSRSKRGFASMPLEKIQAIASKGGRASAEKAGYEGMARRGHEGGIASTKKASHEELVKRGHLGGIASAESRRQSRMDVEYDNDEIYGNDDDDPYA